MKDNPICVALDLTDRAEIMTLAESLESGVGMLKVGLTAYGSCGPELVSDLAQITDVFLDLKLHDIPAQVAGAVSAVEPLGPRFLTVHASGGRAMLEAAVRAADDIEILGVTVLTSLDDDDLSDIGMNGTSSDQVARLADLAMSAGVDGLVCSPLEVSLLRSRFGPVSAGGPILVVPGIRPHGSDRGDQRRTMTPAEAIKAGADHIVIGRPITGSADPLATARAVLAEVIA
ncbi:MAG: orotidine-5'-phosphate decarboxylase [Actinobacteria bacterium]|nr:orotidine-5'-phosphate decarboxylase [Actinomycetota bacterium]